MSSFIDLFRGIADDLSKLGVRWALVGGLSIGARAEARFTRDVDVVVSTGTDQDAEAITHALVSRGYRIKAVLEQTATHRMATVRLASPRVPGGIVDLLFASSGVEAEIIEHAEPLEVFPGMVAPVACIGHLLALKVLARDDNRRPQDRSDLQVLFKVATPSDINMAVDTLGAITAKGFNRERDLRSAFEQAVIDFGAKPENDPTL